MALLVKLLRSSDKGAVAVFGAISLLVLMGFMAYAADYGVFWTARGQAQNAADAAAMATAISWAFDVPDAGAEDATPDQIALRATLARESAVAIAKNNLVWNKSPSIDGTTDVHLPPTYTCPAGSSANNCFKVEVYRDSAHSNALPVFFAHLFGVTSQNMKATATGALIVAGASDCIVPFSLPDRWEEYDDKGKLKKFEQDKSKFEKYEWDGKKDDVKDLKSPDKYVPPGPGGTGYKPTDSSVGGKKAIKVDDMQWKVDKKDKTQVEQFVKEGVKGKSYIILEIPRKDAQDGPDGYAANWASCNGEAVRIGDYVPMLNTKTKTKSELEGITLDAVQALVESDPGAKFDAKTGKITGSNGKNGGISPRIVNVALFDPDQWTDCVVGKITCDTKTEVKLVNVVGFFIECEDSKKSTCKAKEDGKFRGRIMPALGKVVSGPPPDDDYAFLKAFGIVR